MINRMTLESFMPTPTLRRTRLRFLVMIWEPVYVIILAHNHKKSSENQINGVNYLIFSLQRMCTER